MNKFKSISVILSIAGAIFSSSTWAVTNLWDPTLSTNNVIGNSSVQLDGTLNDILGQTEPWTVQVYGTVGECLRILVPSTNFDSKITVIAPNGSVYRDDNSGGANRPLVKIASAPNKGWYTVHVASATGTVTAANFTLLYGRYNGGNLNCSGETVPF